MNLLSCHLINLTRRTEPGFSHYHIHTLAHNSLYGLSSIIYGTKCNCDNISHIQININARNLRRNRSPLATSLMALSTCIENQPFCFRALRGKISQEHPILLSNTESLAPTSSFDITFFRLCVRFANYIFTCKRGLSCRLRYNTS